MPMIFICPLSRLDETLRASGAREVLTLMMPGADVPALAGRSVARQEIVSFSDIVAPRDGYLLATPDHVRRILDFVLAWDRRSPLVIHCFAGISRSPAAAFITACALAPGRDETALAAELRRLSPSATPNRHLVGLADAMLGREGRMSEAIRMIGRGADAFEGECFHLSVDI